jgi:AraC-like DNA-binding protein
MNRAPIRLSQMLRDTDQAWRSDPGSSETLIALLWATQRRLTRNPAIGALLGAKFVPEDCEHFGSWVLASPTIEDAITRLFASSNRNRPHLQLNLVRSATETALTLHHPYGAEAVRDDVELRLACLNAMIRWFDRLERPPVLVRLRAPQPAYADELKKTFGCAVEFSQQCDALIIDSRVTQEKVWGSAHLAERILRQYELEAGVPLRLPSLAERVAAILRLKLDLDSGRQKSVADELHMSPRTLARRLAEESQSYWAILEAVRAERFRVLSQVPGLPAKEMARMLGYSTTSNLRKAARRWPTPAATVRNAQDDRMRAEDE